MIRFNKKYIKYIIKRSVYEHIWFPVFVDLLYLINKRKFKAKTQEIRINKKDKRVSMRPFEDLNCLFIHIPKTGGSSINQSLFDFYSNGHYNYLQYKLFYGSKRYNQFFKIAFVRNPWDRLVSNYHYFKSGGGTPKELLWSKENIYVYDDFNDFVKEWFQIKTNRLSKIHFHNQADFICNRSGKRYVDFVGKFEQIESDFIQICEKLEIERELCWINKSERLSDYRDYYNNESIKIVSEIYKRDIQLFDYKF